MVKKARPVIVWNNRASIYFRKAYEYIKEESQANAEKVKVGITTPVIVGRLTNNLFKA